jgi:hypothetical protein
MKLRHFLLLASLAPATLHAATEFENGLVPVELVRQFTSGSVYRSLPDGFPVVSLPAGTDVRLLGGMLRGTTRDALLTTQNVAGLYLALMTAYKAAGWVLVGEDLNVGFSRLCHDRLGYLSITRPAATYGGLRLTHTPATFPPGQGCASVGDLTPWLNYFFGLMPLLTPPPQARPAASFTPYTLSMRSARYASAGGGTVVLESEQNLTVPDINIAGLYAHYAARLGEQGWAIDSEDTGVRSATAVAYKVAAPPANVTASDTQLTGFLTIRNTGGTIYRVTLAMEAMTDGSFNLNSYFAVPYDVTGNGLGVPLNDPQLGIRGLPAGYTGR